jgi:hypothetical protein
MSNSRVEVRLLFFSLTSLPLLPRHCSSQCLCFAMISERVQLTTVGDVVCSPVIFIASVSSFAISSLEDIQADYRREIELIREKLPYWRLRCILKLCGARECSWLTPTCSRMWSSTSAMITHGSACLSYLYWSRFSDPCRLFRLMFVVFLLDPAA